MGLNTLLADIKDCLCGLLYQKPEEEEQARQQEPCEDDRWQANYWLPYMVVCLQGDPTGQPNANGIGFRCGKSGLQMDTEVSL